MPELPEVETIKTQLHSILPFKMSTAYFAPLSKRIVKQKDFDPTGFSIIKINRHAKWLIFELEPHGFILSHLGMSGSWRMSSQRLNEKHGHIEFISHQEIAQINYTHQVQENKVDLNYSSSNDSSTYFSSSNNLTSSCSVLTYIDPRRFGHFYLLNHENFRNKIQSLPTDVSSDDFDENRIAELFFKFPYKILKPFLLDQKAFPGIGNYMASEICARAGVLPTRLTGDLEAHEILKIKEAIQTVIKGAIETKGTTFGGGYRDTQGSKGEGVKHLVVFYQKYCQMCLAKNSYNTVTKLTLGGRGTYYCSQCQK